MTRLYDWLVTRLGCCCIIIPCAALVSAGAVTAGGYAAVHYL